MDTKDLNGPAPEEQSGNENNDAGNLENAEKIKRQEEVSPEDGKTGDDEAAMAIEPVKDVPSGTDEEIIDPDLDEIVDPDAEEALESYVEEAVESEAETGEPAAGKPAEPADEKPAEFPDKEPDEEEPADEKPAEPAQEKVGDGKRMTPAGEDRRELPEEADDAEETGTAAGQSGEEKGGPSDYQNLDKEELLKKLEELIESRTVQNIRDEVEAIKISFYKRHKAEIEQRRKKFMQEGGEADAFEPGEDEQESRFKELYRQYRQSKAAHNRSQEQNKQANLDEKLSVIEDLKELVNRNEDINQTFPEFRKLQKRWHSIGMVPQQNLKDLWDTYHHYVETFYDHIKINKELRDLDLKKNLETKIELCEKAEELLLAPNIITAFRQLQKYHDQWRETGPVPRDQKDAIWERFREVTHQINKKHQEHFDKQKESQKRNLDAKTSLCEKAESINETQFENFQQVEKLTKEMIAIQRTWKTIGFAPRKDNTKIYQRFRNACDRFFARKREYNTQNKEILSENLQKKLDLCVQAEALKDSTDWKKTSDELIELQNTWKEIGPVPRKHYDPVWKRFRAACDHFFNRKSEYFSTIDSKYEDNLKKKLAIIEKIENLKVGDNLDANLAVLKEYQREWVSIGFVPIKEKDTIQKRYRAALDKHFEGLKVDDQKKNLMKYRHKLEGVKEKPAAFNKLKFEREKFLNKFKQLENDITLWENNIGFFAKSKTADATIKEFREKIEQGKKQMEILEEKIRMIDDLDAE
jgi:hypothetical protein